MSNFLKIISYKSYNKGYHYIPNYQFYIFILIGYTCILYDSLRRTDKCSENVKNPNIW